MSPYMHSKNLRRFLVITLALVLLGAIYAIDIRSGGIKNLAGVFFVDSITEEELKEDYDVAQNSHKKIKILIVPGHDDELGGTSFREMKEWELNVEMAEILTTLLRQEDEFDVILTRNRNEFNQNIQTYIEENRDSIEKFREEHKNKMDSLITSGLIDAKRGIEHNKAPSRTAIRLYGINKWANEHDIDIVLHIHFNDYPRASHRWAGKYSGSTIYIPEGQFSNAKTSATLAKKVFEQITNYSAPSDMPQERAGIIEDQELIAVGAYNTLDSAVLLLEYGYIYEPQFINKEVRTLALEELALQTYTGILNFFEKNNTSIYNTATLPYLWNENLKKGMKGSKDVFALQTALAFQFIYPPKTKSKNDCPINGNFGHCTAKAVVDFQKKYNIEPSSGFVGPMTRAKLNELYSHNI